MTINDKIQLCCTNLTAWLDYYQIPYNNIIITKQDRIYITINNNTINKLNNLNQNTIVRWDAVKNHGTTALYGWRENRAHYSVQLIVHENNIMEVDVDVWNPDYGLAPASLHLLEIAIPGKTNHTRVRRNYISRGILAA